MLCCLSQNLFLFICGNFVSSDKSQQELAKLQTVLFVFRFHLGRNNNSCLSCVSYLGRNKNKSF